jgi:hypothetical protein
MNSRNLADLAEIGIFGCPFFFLAQPYASTQG